MRLRRTAPWIGGTILGFDVLRWSLATLDQISRWETFTGLQKYLPFANNLWFVPVTVILGFVFITIGARTELQEAITAPASLVVPSEKYRPSLPTMRERFWKIPLRIIIAAPFLAGVWAIAWIWSFQAPALSVAHPSITRPEPTKWDSAPMRSPIFPPLTVTNNAPYGIANSGTIGQATVINNGSIERHLNQQQTDALKSLATSFPESIAQYLSVEAIDDIDSKTYASEILKILSDAGRVKNKHGLITRYAGDDPSIRGAHVIVTDENDPNFSYAQQLANALTSKEAPVVFGPATLLKSGEFKVVIFKAPVASPDHAEK